MTRFPRVLACLAFSLAPRAGEGQRVVRPGIEVLVTDSLHLIAGKRVGLITNHSGRDSRGVSSIDVLARAPGVNLVALYGPEHGLRGIAEAGEKVASTVDSATGIPVHSLYGETRAPTKAMLEGVDVLVYDIQDVGARTYTYQWTMALAAETSGKPFIVLDRPNPIRGDIIEGGTLDKKFSSFVGAYPVALRYGLTAGELLRYLVGTKQVAANVTVIPMQGWSRAMWYDETGLPWVNPSPNIKSLDGALVYTGTVLFEGTNLSEGRGTDAPFQLIGAPWLTDAGGIASALNARRIPGVRFDSTSRNIAAGQKHGGATIPMIQVIVTDRNRLRAMDVGLAMLEVMYARHRKEWSWRGAAFDRLAGSDRLRLALVRGGSLQPLRRILNAESARFARAVRPFLLYH